MEKYTVPNIPNTQLILEDLNDMDIVSLFQTNINPPKIQERNEVLQNAHACYENFRQLQGDLIKQDVLNAKLDELNQKLVENIANMKK